MPRPHDCPDCDEPLAYTFEETSGLSGWKRGAGTNLEPDTWHYVCFPCRTAWKQRLDGPLTPDVVGELTFFSCKIPECGASLATTHESLVPTEVRMTCGNGHAWAVVTTGDGGLTLEAATTLS